MRTLVVFLMITFFHLPLSAQDVWNDYVIGRPMVGYYDAKKVVAQEWGFNYKVTFAGCILSDEISDKARSYQNSNNAYFETLASKYGHDWMQDFELEVKKEVHRNTTQEKGTWYEIADNNKDKAFYTFKKAVAKTWGISYEAQFISEDMSASDKATLTERFLANNDYVQQLKNTFGQNWQDKLTQEVNFEIAKQEVANHNQVWVDYVIGKPYMVYFEAKKAVAQEWGIHYEPQFKGCNLSKKMEKEAIKVETANAPYFKFLEKQFGKDWKVRFDSAVQKRVVKEQLNQ